MPALSYDGVPAGWIHFVESMQARLEKARDEANTTLERMNVSATVTSVHSDLGRFGVEFERHALCADCVLIPERALLENAVGRLLFQSGLFHCRKPVLLLGHQRQAVAETIVVAWKSDPHSAAAIHFALPYLKRANRVVLTTVDPESTRDGPNPGHNMAAYLAHHGVAVTVENRASAGASVADVLVQCVTDQDADMLVAGAFGRSRLADWMLGSSTSRVLETCSASVFLAH